MSRCPKCNAVFSRGSYCPTDWIPLVPDDDLSGAVVGGYALLSRLSHGTMGTVYKARQQLTGFEFALKIFNDRWLEGVEQGSYFRRYEAFTQVRHPGAVDLFDLKQDGALTFLVMELLPGETLETLLRRGDRLTHLQALEIAAQIAEVLALFHEQGILHNYLDPSHVMLTRDGRAPRSYQVKLLDVGLHNVVLQPADPKAQTDMPRSFGEPFYLSPEQCESSSLIDDKTDVYALGVILYQMVSGRLPFDGELRGNVMLEHLCDPVPSLRAKLPRLPLEVEQLILRALEKERGQRFASMKAMLSEIQNVLRCAQIFEGALSMKRLGLGGLEVELAGYKILRGLRSDDLGDVYLAVHRLNNRRCTLQTINQGLLSVDEQRRQVEEITASQQVLHPGLAKVVEVHQRADGFTLLMEEHLPGETLHEALMVSNLRPERVVHIGLQLAEALAAAHSAGCLHLRLNPHRIFLAVNGEARDLVSVSTFGIRPGLLFQQEEEGGALRFPSLYRPLAFYYVAPEQLSSGMTSDARADIYAVGVILYQCLSGALPFAPEQPDREALPLRQRIPGLSEALSSIVMRAIERDRELRFSSMQEMRDALVAVRDFASSSQ